MKKHHELLSEFIPLGYLAIVFLIVAILTSMITKTSLFGWISILLAIFVYFFVPGYVALLFLELTAMERVILSFFSGAILTALVLYFLNIVGMMLNKFTVYITIVAIVLILLVIYFFVRKDTPHKEVE